MTFNEEIYNNFVCDFSNSLRQKIQDIEISKLVFLCVGTNRVIGDCFGPLVGYKLKNFFKGERNIEIIGDIENTICFQNICDVVRKIQEDSFVIAIDAALSNKNDIGKIVVSKEKMNIGSGLNKKSIYIGDISIKGIVSKDFKKPQYNFKILQNTSLGLIMNMADCVSQGIYNVINV